MSEWLLDIDLGENKDARHTVFLKLKSLTEDLIGNYSLYISEEHGRYLCLASNNGVYETNNQEEEECIDISWMAEL